MHSREPTTMHVVTHLMMSSLISSSVRLNNWHLGKLNNFPFQRRANHFLHNASKLLGMGLRQNLQLKPHYT